jgi:hypothetical protein
MASQEIHNDTGIGILQAGAVEATANSTNYADLAGFEGVEIIATFESTTASAGNSLLLSVWESDVDSATPAASASYTAAAAADIRGAFTAVAATGNTAQKVGYTGRCRYIFVTMTETGTYIGEVHIAVLGNNPNEAPAGAVTVAALTS